MPASTCPPTKKPSEKFMYAAVTPPSGPRTRMPSASSSAWYFQVPGAGSQRQRGAIGCGVAAAQWDGAHVGVAIRASFVAC